MNFLKNNLSKFIFKFFIFAIVVAPFGAQAFSDGTLDTTFNPGTGADAAVVSNTLQSDGKIIIVGNLTTYNGTSRNRIARLNTDGTLDTTFNPGTGANVQVISTTLQSDGKIIIGGNFTTYNGTSINRIARLNTDGTLDATFNPGTGASGAVRNITLQSDGKMIIGGDFTTYNGTSRNRIARLNTDGTLDTTFNPGTGANILVNSTTLQSDGKIIIGGDFTTYNGTSRNRIARLNTDGTLDTTFNPGTGASGSVGSVNLQSDGKIIIGGFFTTYNGTSRNRIARLNTDGTLDTTFNPGTGADNLIFFTALQSDGKIIIGGNFTTYNGTSRNRIARLNTDGTLDTTFNPTTGADNNITFITLQSDGKIIITGPFTAYNGVSRNRVARLSTLVPVDTTPPTISQVTPVTTPSNDTTPSYTFTTNEAGTITYGGSCSSATTTATVGSNTVTFNTLPAGTYSTCTIRVTDAATNVSNILNIPSFTIDTTPDAAPATPDLATASDTGSSATDNVTTDTTPSFILNCVTGSTVTIYNNGTPLTPTGVCTGGTITLTPTLTEGTHSITATQTDTAGNTSATSAPVLVVIIDATAPTTPGIQSVGGDTTSPYLTNDTTPAVVITTELGDTVTIPGFTCTPTPATGTTVTCTPTTPYTDGTHSFTPTITDQAGNSTVGVATSVTVDALAPTPTTPDLATASDTGVNTTDNQTNDTTPSFNITCTEPGTITLYEEGTPVASYTCTGTETATITAPAVPSDGSYDYTTTASDLAGNISGSSPTLTVTIDTSITATTINTPTTGTPVSGNAEPGSTVTVTTPSGSSCTTTTSITGSYSCNLTPLPTDGENITATATDTYGNISSVTQTGGIDTDAPITPTINPVTAGSTTITGTGENGTTITVTGITCTNAPVIISGGVWSCTILATDAPEKGDTITVVSTDSAGNTAQGSYVIPKPKSVGSRKLTTSQVNAIFGTSTTTNVSNIFKGKTCSANMLLSQNMKAGARNGQYHSYTKTTVNEVKVLQAHMNRLGFESGPVDGILGPITDGAIKRMQKYLGTRTDGLVGPITRSLINQSC
jgi:uncharacterized delta-60 repeat protein